MCKKKNIQNGVSKLPKGYPCEGNSNLYFTAIKDSYILCHNIIKFDPQKIEIRNILRTAEDIKQSPAKVLSCKHNMSFWNYIYTIHTVYLQNIQ